MSQEVKEFYEMMYRWAQEGLVRKDAVTVADNAVPDMKAGKHIAAINATYKPAVKIVDPATSAAKRWYLPHCLSHPWQQRTWFPV